MNDYESKFSGEIYYTIAEICALLKCSKPTLWRKCKFDGLRKFKSGGLVRFRKSVVDKWMDDHEDDGSSK